MSTDIADIKYILMASNDAGASSSIRSRENTLSIPDRSGWSQIGEIVDINYAESMFASDFMARADSNGNDIVLAYSGTTEEEGGSWQDWIYGNLPGGTGVVLPALTL